MKKHGMKFYYLDRIEKMYLVHSGSRRGTTVQEKVFFLISLSLNRRETIENRRGFSEFQS